MRRTKRKGTNASESMAKRARSMHERANLENIRALLKDFEGRRTALAAMAKSLVEREKAEVVNFKGVA